jgi:hypothetical protein
MTWLSFLSLAMSAAVTPPGTAAMTSGTTRRGSLAGALGELGELGSGAGTTRRGVVQAAQVATITRAAASAPATVAGRDARRTLRILTVTQLYKAAGTAPRPGKGETGPGEMGNSPPCGSRAPQE